MKNLILALSLILIAGPAFAMDKNFERVMEKRELRCAYTIYPPFIIKDPNTGTFSGLFYDFLEEMGKQLNIKIVWAEEVGSDNIFHGLNTNRYDAVCAGYASTPARANGGLFTKPIVFIPGYLYVREDESRAQNFREMNDPAYTIGTMDGEMSQIFKNAFLPNAKELSVSGLTQAPERLEMIALKKADATIVEGVIGDAYMAANPGKLKPLGDPVYTLGSVVIVPHGAHDLKEYLNVAIDDMVNSGTIDRIIDQYKTGPNSFFPPLKPYEISR